MSDITYTAWVREQYPWTEAEKADSELLLGFCDEEKQMLERNFIEHLNGQKIQ